jgi:hypothetical protein
MNLKNKDNYVYKYPHLSCKECVKYPCLSNFQKLKSNFAKFGCKYFEKKDK